MFAGSKQDDDLYMFFFSSRRRHTRFKCDWSSDVCSSDLSQAALKFRAVAGLPRNPLPTYATFVIEGTVDLDRGTGIVTKSLYAGAPQAMSNILFPGTARTIRVTTVDRSANHVRLGAVVDAGAALTAPETRNVPIVLVTCPTTARPTSLPTAT